jgi:uncharacterized membrane protein
VGLPSGTVRGVAVVVGLAYPFVVYVGLGVMSPRAVASALAGLLVAQGAIRLRSVGIDALRPLAGPGLLVGAILLLAATLDEGRLFLFAPVLVNVGLLVTFARTLGHGPSMVERLARSRHRELAPGGSTYCRHVTIAWTVFFASNATLILWLGLFGTLAQWTFYTGFLAYVAMGLIWMIEAVYRTWRFPDEAGMPFARLRRVLLSRRER